jgi:Bacterial regulatory protein, Fis family
MILRTLEATGGNQSVAAEQLGIPRRTFCRKLNEHHISLGRRSRSAASMLSSFPSNYRAELRVPVTIRTKERLLLDC